MSLVVQPGQLTPGIPANDYERRRKKLMDMLPDDSLVVCTGGQVKFMSGREHFHTQV